MKEILKDYIDTIREIKSLEDRKEELLKKLLHVQTPDGKEIADIVLDDRIGVKELIVDNLPDDADDDEIYKESHIIRDQLYFLREIEVKEREYAECYSSYGNRSVGCAHSDPDTFWDYVESCNDPRNEC